MKARLLTKLLNNTRYIVNNNNNYIGIGSPLCHDLISVNKKTLEIKYALDTWHQGRKSLTNKENKELLFIWDKLQELINNGEIKNIIEGIDNIENPLLVYTIRDGKLIETFTDKYGYPNTDINGYIMYDNTYFKNKIDAINYGIKECQLGIKMLEENLQNKKNEIIKIENLIKKEKNNLKILNERKH